MVDRVKLLNWALPNAELNTKQKAAITTAVEKALDETLSGVPLSAALSIETKRDLVLYLSDLAPAKTLLAISNRWEPERKKIDVEQKSDLKHDLVSLLMGERKTYSPTTATLSEVREMNSDELATLSYSISRLAPPSDLSKLIKRWDPDLPKKPTKREEQVPHLLALATDKCPPHPSKKLSFQQFRERVAESGEIVLDQIDTREAASVVQARVKKWDRYLQPQPVSKVEAVRHIRDIVSGVTELSPKPPTKRKK